MTTSMQFRSDFTIRLVQSMGSDASILAAMMVSTKGVDSQEMLDRDPAEAAGKIEFLMRNRHGTPFEHSSMTFLVEAPIAVYREWHRHRIGVSINEESGRYKKLEPVFYVPPQHRPLVQEGPPGHYVYVPGNEEQWQRQCDRIKRVCTLAYEEYESALDDGIAKEVARGVLPVYIYSSMYWTCNPRSLMAFLSLRSTRDGYVDYTQLEIPETTFPSFPMWEIEQCALSMEEEFSGLFPITHQAFRKFGSVSP